MPDLPLNRFLRPYGVMVKELVELSGQSPQTIRNWHNVGCANDKSWLVLCMIASYKWRKETFDTRFVDLNLKKQGTLGSYLLKFNVEIPDLEYVSGQSPQTLRNWYYSIEKHKLIDVLIDAVCWHRYARNKNAIGHNYDYAQLTYALTLPITKVQDKTTFPLSKFLESHKQGEIKFDTRHRKLVSRKTS